jgi:MFS transporter, PHS family, inorganic phosphate transporter
LSRFSAAALVALIIVSAYKSVLLKDSPTQLNHVDYMWRLLIGLGCVPGAIALYFRLTIPETPRFTMDIERNVKQASQDIDNVLSTGKFVVDPDAVIQRVQAPKASRKDFAAHFSKWENLKVLIGTSYSWFALDVSKCLSTARALKALTTQSSAQIAFYGLGLNSSIILQAIGFGTPPVKGIIGVYDNLKNICVGNLILSAAGLVPGYYASFLLIDSWGRKPIQLMGFSILTVLFATLGKFPNLYRLLFADVLG